MGVIKTLWNGYKAFRQLNAGESLGTSLGTAFGVSDDNIFRNLVDNSLIGSTVNNMLGNSASVSAQELALRNEEWQHEQERDLWAYDKTKELRDSSITSAYNQLKELGLNPYAILGSGGATGSTVSVHPSSGFAASKVSANSSYRNTRLSTTAGVFNNVANSAISALSRIGSSAIFAASRTK